MILSKMCGLPRRTIATIPAPTRPFGREMNHARHYRKALPLRSKLWQGFVRPCDRRYHS